MFDKKHDELFIKILLWAYTRQEKGFTEEELRAKFYPDQKKRDEVYPWIRRVFIDGSNSDRPLITALKSDNGKDYYAISDKGIATVLQYSELTEARESSKQAKWMAILAILISAIVGMYQIIVPQNVLIVQQNDMFFYMSNIGAFISGNIGILTNLLGSLLIVVSIGKIPKGFGGTTTTDDGKEYDFAYVVKPRLLKVGLVLMVIGFLLQLQ